MANVLDEMMQEADHLSANGKHKGCTCGSCQDKAASYELNNEIAALGRHLSEAEEYEWKAALDSIKRLGRKLVNKTRKPIAIAKIIHQLVSPAPPPHQVTKDVAAYLEEDKKQQRQQYVEGARQQPNQQQQRPPDKEVSLMQEIIGEAEMEWAGELEGFLDTGKDDGPPPTKRETPNAKKAWGEFHPTPPPPPPNNSFNSFSGRMNRSGTQLQGRNGMNRNGQKRRAGF
jgi:hypothetical protein